jgi:hypothetical protein
MACHAMREGEDGRKREKKIESEFWKKNGNMSLTNC